jgi:hypothetical protein
MPCGVCSLVIQRFFDIIEHAVTAEKLTKLPLPRNVINHWFISFPTDCKIILKFNSVLSQPSYKSRRFKELYLQCRLH